LAAARAHLDAERMGEAAEATKAALTLFETPEALTVQRLLVRCLELREKEAAGRFAEAVLVGLSLSDTQPAWVRGRCAALCSRLVEPPLRVVVHQAAGVSETLGPMRSAVAALLKRRRFSADDGRGFGPSQGLLSLAESTTTAVVPNPAYVEAAHRVDQLLVEERRLAQEEAELVGSAWAAKLDEARSAESVARRRLLATQEPLSEKDPSAAEYHRREAAWKAARDRAEEVATQVREQTNRLTTLRQAIREQAAERDAARRARDEIVKVLVRVVVEVTVRLDEPAVTPRPEWHLRVEALGNLPAEALVTCQRQLAEAQELEALVQETCEVVLGQGCPPVDAPAALRFLLLAELSGLSAPAGNHLAPALASAWRQMQTAGISVEHLTRIVHMAASESVR
jgi:hypothetical protein